MRGQVDDLPYRFISKAKYSYVNESLLIEWHSNGKQYGNEVM